MIKIIKYFLEALTIYIFFFISKVIGLLLSRKFSSYIFKFLGPLIKSNKIINKNLLKFPKKLSDQNKKDIADSVWANYGMTFVEYIFLNKFRRENSHIDIRGEDILKKIIKNDKPVIFISGHFANFEFMSMEITKKKLNWQLFIDLLIIFF
jgi:KDO2-lipid IV(A) lauroyltransferase